MEMRLPSNNRASSLDDAEQFPKNLTMLFELFLKVEAFKTSKTIRKLNFKNLVKGTACKLNVCIHL